MFLELLSVAVLGGKLINEKIEQNKPYKHVFNRPQDIESRREAQALYDRIRREYEERTGKKADW